MQQSNRCDHCNITYAHRQSLWRHKQKCIGERMRKEAASYPNYYQGGRVKTMTIDADLGKLLKPNIVKSRYDNGNVRSIVDNTDRMKRHEPGMIGSKDGQNIEDVKHDENIEFDDDKDQESHNHVRKPDNSKVKDPKIEALIKNIIDGPDTSDTNHLTESSKPSLVDELNSMPFDVEKNQDGSKSERNEENHKTVEDEIEDDDAVEKDRNDTEEISTNNIIQDSSTDPKTEYNDGRNKEDYGMEQRNISSIIDKHRDVLTKVKEDTDLQVKSQNQVRNKNEIKRAEKQIDHTDNHIAQYNKANATINIDENEEDHDMDKQNISPNELKERLYCRKNNLMKVYELNIPANNELTDFALLRCIDLLKVPEFRGIFMLDELPERINPVECGIVNISIFPRERYDPHWICYAKIFSKSRICFDSFCGETPLELQKYLKTSQEFRNRTPVIERNCRRVQRKETFMTGHLCLFVLTSLMRDHFTFPQVVDQLEYGFSENLW